MGFDNVNVNVSGPVSASATYKTVVLKPNMVDGVNLLTQEMMNSVNTKYVIKHDFVLTKDVVEDSVNVLSTNISQCVNPAYANALAAYNSAHDAWIDADNAYTNNPNETTLAAKNAAYAVYNAAQTTLNNTPQYYFYASKSISIKKHNHIELGEGAVLLNSALNGTIEFDVASSNITVYIGSTIPGTYSYTIKNAITMPSGCLIEFDGGSIDKGFIYGNDTVLIYRSNIEEVVKGTELLGTWVYNNFQLDKLDNTNGMGRIYLKPNQAFADQLTLENTIYIIQHDFDLGGDNVTIPANCVLEFDGGSLRNGNIILNNTFIDGTPLIQVVLDGTCRNNEIYAEWFGIKSGDAYIQNNNTIFNTYIIPSMENILIKLDIKGSSEVYFSTPLVFSGKYNINFEGHLLYSGDFSTTAITIGGSVRSIAKHYRIEYLKSTSTTYSSEVEVPDYVGLCFLNVMDCKIDIGYIESFAYNVKFYGQNTGCASNIVNIRELTGYFYTALMLFSEGSSAWINENHFICGEFYPSSQNPYRLNGTAIGVHIKATDQSSNGNLFVKPSFEGNPIAIKLDNARYNTFFGVRFENSSIVMEINSSSNNTVLTDYAYNSVQKYYQFNNKAKFISDIVFRDMLLVKEDAILYDNNNIPLNFTTIRKDNGFVCPFGYSNSIYNLIGVILEISHQANFVDIYSKTTNKLVVGIFDDTTHKLKDISSDDVSDYISEGIFVKEQGESRVFVANTGTRRTMIKFKYPNAKKVFVGAFYKYENIITEDLSIRGCFVTACDTYKLDTSNKVIEFNDFDTCNLNFAIRENYIIKLNKNVCLLTNASLFSSNTIICNGGTVKGNDTLNINNAKVLPDYNSLLNSELTVSGMPAAGTLYWQNGQPTWSDGSRWIEEDGAAYGVSRSGAYSTRPSALDIYIGFKYWLSFQNKPIYYGGSDTWYNPDGTVFTP